MRIKYNIWNIKLSSNADFKNETFYKIYEIIISIINSIIKNGITLIQNIKNIDQFANVTKSVVLLDY